MDKMGLLKTFSRGSWITLKATTKGAVFVAGAGCKATAGATRIVYRNREKIAGATVGTAKGTANIITGIRGSFYAKNEMKRCLERIDQQASTFKAFKSRFEHKLNEGLQDKKLLLDTLVVGGESLATYGSWGMAFPSVQKAYEMAYPHAAAEYTFAEQLQRLEGRELIGFASGLKGKLFEQQYVEYLNQHVLENGFSAALAPSPTNTGWDIAVYRPDGSIDELLQAKATNSTAYVIGALEANPHIDVVTTSEVHSSLAMQGFSDVIDSGISDATLQEAIQTAFDSTDITISWMPSIISLSIIAISASRQQHLSAYARSRQFGERAMKSYFAFIVGGAVAVATNTWWLAILGGAGSRILIGSGNRRLGEVRRLRELLERNDQVLARLETQYGF